MGFWYYYFDLGVAVSFAFMAIDYSVYFGLDFLWNYQYFLLMFGSLCISVAWLKWFFGL